MVDHELDADLVIIGFVLGEGGDALQMLELATGMRARGARVRVVVPELPSTVSFGDRCKTAGIECQRSQVITDTMFGSRLDPRAIARLLRSGHESIVHFHTGESCLPRLVMLTLLLQRPRPVFVTLHNPYETIVPGSARGAAVGDDRSSAALGSRFPEHTRIPVPDSVRRPGGAGQTIPNSINLDEMATGDPKVARERLGVDDQTPLVVVNSRLEAQKRPLEALSIFAGVAADHPTAQLVFVGIGELHDRIVSASEALGLGERVRMVGYQTNVPDWLAAATVWLLPTERENFSVAVLEAMAAGCAVLSTRCRGNDEVLVDKLNARTFDVGDIAEAQALLKRLLAGEEERRRLGTEAKRTAAVYSVDGAVEKYLILYQLSPVVPPSLGTDTDT